MEKNDQRIPGFGFNPRSITLPDIKTPPEYAFLTIVEQLRQFESETGEEEVVGALLASFGQSVTLHIHSIRRTGQFFCLEGVTGDGEKATLLQHYTQASLLLLKVPKSASETKRPIGFISE